MAWSSRQSTFGTTPADRLQLEADLRIGSRTAPLSWFGSGCPSILFGDDFRIDTEARGYLKRTRRTQKIKRAQRTRRTQKIRRTRRTRSKLEFLFLGLLKNKEKPRNKQNEYFRLFRVFIGFYVFVLVFMGEDEHGVGPEPPVKGTIRALAHIRGP